MTTNNNNQTETNTPTFEKGQEVWVKAIIEDPEIDWDGDIKFMRYHQGGRVFGYAPPREIRTTEQIWKDVIKNDRKSDKFRVYIDDVCQGLNNYYIYAPDGTEYVYPKDSFTPGEVLQICNGENAKITVQNAEKNADPTTISNTETVTEPEFVNKLKEGDTVKLVERWGRKPPRIEDIEEDGFELNGTYVVDKAEDFEYDVRITNGQEYAYVPFIFLDLVEPASEQIHKLFSDETIGEHYIKNIETDSVVVTYSMEYYTLEEAQAECDRLNQKENEQ